jgi:dolichyl-phosphate beta-glucosyltransferase
MTPPRTATIRDTQCGFKLFSRPSLPYMIPYMHNEGWIFDVEMLMPAEFAGIPVVEVPIGWREVLGSKLNVIPFWKTDSHCYLGSIYPSPIFAPSSVWFLKA